MNTAPHGLHRAPDAELTRLLRALHKGDVPAPIGRAGLVASGFGNLEADLDVLVGMDAKVAQRVIGAVLAERRTVRAAQAQLAMVAPPAPGTASRDVMELVKELLFGAERSVHVFGARLDDEAALTRSLRALIGGREVAVQLVLDLHGEANPADRAARYLETNFPDRHRPELFYADSFVSGARALVVDAKRCLLTSGTFSRCEEDGRLELGAVIDDSQFAEALLSEWQRLVDHGHLSACGAAPPP